MSRSLLTVIFVVSCLLSHGVHVQAQGQGIPKRSAQAIVGDFHRVQMPTMSTGVGEKAESEFAHAINHGCERKAALALELYRGYPDHDSVPKFLSIRWAGQCNTLGRAKDVLDETIALLKTEKREKIRHQALLAACRATMVLDQVPVAKKLRYANAACDVVPEEEGGPLALVDIAKYHLSDVKKIRALCQKVEKSWGHTTWAGPAARGVLKQLKKLGRSTSLKFTDILTEKQVRSKDFAGQPLVLMIWGGFGESIDADLELIKNCRSKGKVNIVGRFNWRYKGGAAGLRAALSSKGIDWPQEYVIKDGQKPWEGEWGTGEMPLYFLIDGGGKVVSLSYRFKNIHQAYKKLHRPIVSKKTRKL